MPTKRINRTRRPISTMTPEEFEGMVTGQFFFEEATEDRMRELWADHRAELESYYAQDPEQWAATGNRGKEGQPEPAGPFHRCWAWWRYTAPEPRKRIANKGKGNPIIETAPNCQGWQREFSFGIPRFWDRHVNGDEYKQWFETERAYLLRHPNLLTAQERKILKQE